MDWKFLTSNHLLNLGLAAWLIAQSIKTVVFSLRNKKISWKRFMEAGGMPSAHSAMGCAVAAGAAEQYGFASPVFALALTFALIIMYDAMGVRYAAGRQAYAINLIVDYLDKKASPDSEPLRQHIHELQEVLGHRPLEVACGAALGIFIALIPAIGG